MPKDTSCFPRYLFARHQEAGRYLTADEEASLARLRDQGEPGERITARNELAMRNVLLAVNQAKYWAARLKRPLEACASDALEGLIEAAGQFDPARGRMTTTVIYYIKKCTLASFETQPSVIKIPIDKVFKSLAAEDKDADPTIGQAWRASLVQSFASLAIDHHQADGDWEPADYRNSDAEPDPVTIPESIWEGVRPREARAIRLRFGLEPIERGQAKKAQRGFAASLDEVGKELGVTKERVRQLINAGLAKLRRSPELGQIPLPWDECDDEAA